MLLARCNLIAVPAGRIELAEDITAHASACCARLLTSPDAPEHVRWLTSPRVLDVEGDLIQRLASRAAQPARRVRLAGRGLVRIDPTQAAVVGLLAGDGRLVVVEGAAGVGKTTALRTTQELMARQRHRLVVVTPTLKAVEVAAAETGADGHSAAWPIHQHGWRWDADGHWTRQPGAEPAAAARLGRGDLLVVDEAAMLDQDTALAVAWATSNLLLNATRLYDTALLSHVQDERAVVSAEGKVHKTSKDRLRKEPRLARSYDTILRIVIEAYGKDSDIVAQFKAWAEMRYRASA